MLRDFQHQVFVGLILALRMCLSSSLTSLNALISTPLNPIQAASLSSGMMNLPRPGLCNLLTLMQNHNLLMICPLETQRALTIWAREGQTYTSLVTLQWPGFGLIELYFLLTLLFGARKSIILERKILGDSTYKWEEWQFPVFRGGKRKM